MKSAEDVHQIVNRVQGLKKEKHIVVAPNGEQAAWILLQRKRGGNAVTIDRELNKFVHERYVIHDDPISRIGKLVFKEFDRIVSNSVITSLLDQERETESVGFDSLREDALKKETVWRI